ncbi:MAG: L-histidine N(alpha)-methyltransferase [Calditrichia bacterium]
MSTTTVIDGRFTLIQTPLPEKRNSFAEDVERGLRERPRYIPSRYFYDYRGSQLFEQITRLPEYYLTRSETEILRQQADQIVQDLPPRIQVVELGSGSSQKTRLLLSALLQKGAQVRYSPVDISGEMLRISARSLLNDFPRLEITALAAEYQQALRELSPFHDHPKLVLWLGSSIGNYTPAQAIRFLRELREQLREDDELLIGMDLRKDEAILHAAYNDAAGITAEFNRNLLQRINRELGANFHLSAFSHEARFFPEPGCMKMFLRSEEEQAVKIDAINQTFNFERGERIHTEDSYKFSREKIREIAADSGFNLKKQWFDSRKYFSLNLFKPA